MRHFRSQRVGALLAYMALRLGTRCSREEMYEALWPGEDSGVAANRFRVSLASLRRQMEPPGVAFGSVIDAREPGVVRLRRESVWCDVDALNQAVARGDSVAAGELASGILMPGYYDEWILAERSRLELLVEDLEVAPSGSPHLNWTGGSASAAVAAKPLHSRLPLYLTRFFGREAERERILDLLAGNRLVTLSGPGGIGKTRLAAECARSYPGIAVFVALADLHDTASIPEAILLAHLQAPLPGGDPLAQLGALLQRAIGGSFPEVLILDNAEHLVTEVVTLALRLLQDIPDLRILVTSRQRLDTPGEVVFSVQPLELPLPESNSLIIANYPAVALFLDRAKNSRPDFVPAQRHVRALVEICRRLEGIPLAIELAAAHISTQSPTQIASTLSASVMDLTSNQRGLSPRHRSLRVAIQGSYDLLSEDLKPVFCTMSVFQGGWTERAAKYVTHCENTGEMLAELVARSLVVATEDESTGDMRYSFLETLRQFASELLTQNSLEPFSSSGLRAELAPGAYPFMMFRRHAEYYSLLVARCAPHITSSRGTSALAELAVEHYNIMGALQWAANCGLRELVRSITGSMATFWSGRSHFSEGRQWYEWLRSGFEGDSELERAEIFYGCGRFALKQTEFREARSYIDQALALFQKADQQNGVLRCTQTLGDLDRLTGEHERAKLRYGLALSLCETVGQESDIANCHHGIGIACIYTGNYEEGRLSLERALEIRSRLAHPVEVARTRNLLAFARLELGEDEAARALFETSRDVFVQHGDRWYESSSVFGLAMIAWGNGDIAALTSLLDHGLALMRTIGSRESIANNLYIYTFAHLANDSVPKAGDAARECLDITIQLDTSQGYCYALEACSAVLIRLGRLNTAAQILSCAAAIRERIRFVRNRCARNQIEQMQIDLTRGLCADELERSTASGRLLTQNAAAELAFRELS